MKKYYLDSKMMMIGVKNFKGSEKQIDYYLITNNNDWLYAFTVGYTHNTYDLCKSGILVNDLVGKRTRDTGIMRLVKHINRMLPYLADIYDLPLAA